MLLKHKGLKKKYYFPKNRNVFERIDALLNVRRNATALSEKFLALIASSCSTN